MVFHLFYIVHNIRDLITIYGFQHAMYHMLYIICYMLHAIYYILCHVYYTGCAISSSTYTIHKHRIFSCIIRLACIVLYLSIFCISCSIYSIFYVLTVWCFSCR